MTSLKTSFGEHIKDTRRVLATLQSLRAKKVFLTKDIKAQKAFLFDVRLAVNRDGWLHGVRWFNWDIQNLNSQLEWTKKERERLNQTL